MKTIITNSEKETINLGKLLASYCQGGEIFALEGDLGTGKTRLAQGIALGLGIKFKVTSPTFNIFRVYKINKNKVIKNLYHIDAYRLKSERDLLSLGVKEFLGQKDAVVVIEWADNIKKVFKKNKIIKIIINNLNQTDRLIKIYGFKNF